MRHPADGARQARNNEETAHHWELYAGHRQRLSDAIAAALERSASARLCILGAGNANDLDLERLGRSAREIHLVDLDRAALGRARARTAPGVPLTLHAPIDVGLRAPARWRSSPPGPAERSRLPAEVAAAVSAALPGPFDVVVSACLLSQLYEGCFQRLGRVAWLGDVLGLSLAVHLRVMLALGAGGQGVLATDTLSSETHPLDDVFPEGTERLHELSRSGRLFTGTSPPELLPALRAAGVRAPRLLPPWLWRQARACTLLVYAIRFEIPAEPPITRRG